MVDIALLKTFLELNRTRHFGQTAKRLFLTQSAVSARMRQLEETLGVALFTRDRNNIHLTPAGSRFLKHAENIVTAWNRAKQETALEDESKSLLSISGVHSIWDTGLQQWIRSLREDMPELALQIDVGRQEDLVRNLIEGTIDIAFVYESPQMPELLSNLTGQIELVLVSTYNGILAEEAVSKSDYVMVDWGTSFAITHARQFPTMPAPNVRVGLARLAINLLLNCGGSAYLTRHMVEPYLKEKTLYLVEDAERIHRDVYAVYPQTFMQREAAETILNHLTQHYTAMTID